MSVDAPNLAAKGCYSKRNQARARQRRKTYLWRWQQRYAGRPARPVSRVCESRGSVANDYESMAEQRERNRAAVADWRNTNVHATVEAGQRLAEWERDNPERAKVTPDPEPKRAEVKVAEVSPEVAAKRKARLEADTAAKEQRELELYKAMMDLGARGFGIPKPLRFARNSPQANRERFWTNASQSCSMPFAQRREA